ncbi:hypothetical protein A5720_28210 [Mycolicibacterium conceptionense]|uniref:Uncharacterized protein n=1 Tax=Mycolicibacterium conceptionense TaxID=451644 RepID=A0A1A1X5F8_9MYCO|nr:hypothetical protein [Mycolicibacterium conceptionense]OBF14392.1 hypothetical protein A5726_24835 [Mycolicibacterium conceptionense]OBF31716.1 hypothetical protein A5720_28210 [Mycolicibacterium conceptionense]OBH97010.1 hypothetical protein A5716_16715 [Mycolicibacterium conceptionense]
MNNGIVLIVGRRSVPQVQQPVVSAVAIQVADHKPFGARADEGQHHQLVDIRGMTDIAAKRIDMQVPPAVRNRGEQSRMNQLGAAI